MNKKYVIYNFTKLTLYKYINSIYKENIQERKRYMKKKRNIANSFDCNYNSDNNISSSGYFNT